MESKIKNAIEQHHMIKSGDKILIAVSGGPDSLCLLHILNKFAEEMNYNLHVAHLDHGLRQTAQADAAFVRKFAKNMGIPCTVKQVETKKYQKFLKLSTQDAARRLRYDFLKETAIAINADKIAFGHHRDDQVETVILNFLRGTGLGGLAGIRPVRSIEGGFSIIRPLINVSRKEIEAYCRYYLLSPCEDETNLKRYYRRNKVRLDLIPYIEREFNPNFADRIAVLSEIAFFDQNYLDKEAEKFLGTIIESEGVNFIVIQISRLLTLHEAMQRRILRLVFGRLRGGDLRGIEYKHIISILDLVRGEGYRCYHLPFNIKAVCDYGQLRLSRGIIHKVRHINVLPLRVPGRTLIPETGQVIRAKITSPENLKWPPDSRCEGYLDYDHLQKPLLICSRWPGARFQPFGMVNKKKLKNYLIDEKVPREKRDILPLVISNNIIVWIAGLQIAHPFRVTEDTNKVLVLCLEG